MTAEPPADLIDLRREFLAAEHDHAALCAQWPPAADIAGGADVDVALTVRTDAAHARMQDAAVAIHEHPWWREAGNRADAEKTLRAAADS